jgi:malonyl-CoA O-methyltransferase
MDNPAWKQQVADGFGNAADQYDDHSPVQRASAQHLLGLCPDDGVTDILEIGCGTGALTRLLHDQYKHASLHITDISPAMIAHAQSVITACNISWSVMDGEAPTLDKKYDLIVSNMAMQWFENRERALENLRQYLKPDGQIIYSMPGPQSFRGWHETLSISSPMTAPTTSSRASKPSAHTNPNKATALYPPPPCAVRVKPSMRAFMGR